MWLKWKLKIFFVNLYLKNNSFQLAVFDKFCLEIYLQQFINSQDFATANHYIKFFLLPNKGDIIFVGITMPNLTFRNYTLSVIGCNFQAVNFHFVSPL
jgi:hypothetical protein